MVMNKLLISLFCIFLTSCTLKYRVDLYQDYIAGSNEHRVDSSFYCVGNHIEECYKECETFLNILDKEWPKLYWHCELKYF